MPRYPKDHKDVVFYAAKGKSKKPKRITGSTKATNDFLVIVHEEHPDMTISQLRDLLLDKTKFIYNPEAIAVLDAYIKAGLSELVPGWR